MTRCVNGCFGLGMISFPTLTSTASPSAALWEHHTSFQISIIMHNVLRTYTPIIIRGFSELSLTTQTFWRLLSSIPSIFFLSVHICCFSPTFLLCNCALKYQTGESQLRAECLKTAESFLPPVCSPAEQQRRAVSELVWGTQLAYVQSLQSCQHIPLIVCVCVSYMREKRKYMNERNWMCVRFYVCESVCISACACVCSELKS